MCPELSMSVYLYREPVDIRKSTDGLSLLIQEALERERFKWPDTVGDDIMTLSGQQLNWLLDGYDIARMQPLKTLFFDFSGWFMC